MEEIKAVLTKHDIGGLVVIHTPGFHEYLFKVDPSYSCAAIDPMRGLRVKTNPSDPLEVKKQLVSDTINMLDHFSLGGGNLVMQSVDMLEMLKKKVNWTSEDGGHTGHSQQNN